ncbi:ATP-binding protein [Ruminococcus sp. OA3]|uniref:histidine kinase dimerization/phospho-acceptor domain-containing protein n=1 Tax=Ruminococcus sp. OA3 TaxID=2914164 RepID=UPI001F06F5E3|nr:histidine kinase dimerization/phospho-acceptor domain-containing protein [Ruminococcus sp. OA3]MCH1981088.1 ATP-binding protein [Ruminococcus sp. OA3]
MMEHETRFHFYSKFAKMTTLTLQMLCVAGFVISVVLAGYVMNTVGSLDDLTGHSSYEDTSGCGMDAAQELHQNTQHVKYKPWFETDGEYDENKKIDISGPGETDARNMDKNTTYTVGQLRNILNQVNENSMGFSDILSNWGYYYDTDYYGEEYYDENGYYMGDVSEGASEESTAETRLTDEENYILREMYNAGKRIEVELPSSGVSLADQALKEQSVLYLMQKYENMSNVLDGLSTYLGSRNIDLETNLKYYVRDTATGIIATNVQEWEGKTTGMTEGDWTLLMSYTRDNGKVDFKTGETQAQKYMKNFFRNTPLVGDDEEVIVALDTSYPVSDDFKSNAEWFATYQPKFYFLAGSAILTLLIGIACFIIATIQTGRKEKGGEVILSKFDRLPTEIAVAIGCVFGGLLIGVSISAGWSNSWEAVWLSVLAAVGAVICASFFMGVYLSVVRRIKSKTLWQNSLTRSIVKMSKKVYDARKTSGKIIIAFVGLLLAHFIVIVAFMGFGVFIALIGDALVLLYLIKEGAGRQTIKEGLVHIAEGDLEYKIDVTTLQGENKEMAEHVNRVGEGLQNAMEKSIKNERMKAELITNVSHDIKTPLTSIINYVDLLKRENLQDNKVRGYIEVLDAKSQRLKQLTDDLVEASKVSTGNVELHMTRIQVQQLLQQAYGEFDEKLSAKGLQTILNQVEEPVVIMADGRQLWRIFENLLNNIAKYAMPNTRVYIDLQEKNGKAVMTFKNISEYPLNISADELTERFTRGDESRSTEGSGLGLSIAKNLTELQHGKFDIYLDGDLFKVTVAFDMTFTPEPEQPQETTE